MKEIIQLSLSNDIDVSINLSIGDVRILTQVLESAPPHKFPQLQNHIIYKLKKIIEALKIIKDDLN